MMPRQNNSTLSKNSQVLDDDNRSVRSFRSLRSLSESMNLKNEPNQENGEDEREREKERKMFMSPKVHFKTLVEAYDKCTDDKGK